jgi:hypothetical protein
MTSINYDLLQTINIMYDDLYDVDISAIQIATLIYNNMINLDSYDRMHIISHILTFFEIEYPILYPQISEYFESCSSPNHLELDEVSSITSSSATNEIYDEDNEYFIRNSPIFNIIDQIDIQTDNGQRLNIRIGNNNHQLTVDSMYMTRSINSRSSSSPIRESSMQDVKLTIKIDELKKIKSSIYKDICLNEIIYLPSNPIELTENSSRILDKSCVICLENFNNNDNVRIMPCFHVFHLDCIDKWLLEYNYKCPTCREQCGSYSANI